MGLTPSPRWGSLSDRFGAVSFEHLTPDVAGVRRARLIPIISGQSYETNPETAGYRTNCVVSANTSSVLKGNQCWRMAITGAKTATMLFRQTTPAADNPYCVFPPAQAVQLSVRISAAANITSLTLDIFSDSAANVSWTKSWTSLDAAKDNLWQTFRVKASDYTVTGWGTCHRVRLSLVTTNDVTVDLQEVLVEAAPEPSVCIVADAMYKSFYTDFYPQLRSRNIPIELALNPSPTRMGSGVGTRAEIVSWADVAAVMADKISVVGFHSWSAGTAPDIPTHEMTEDQIYCDTYKCIAAIMQRGYPRPMWRAAWTSNLAHEAHAAQSLLLGYATPQESTGAGVWPPIDRWNIFRYALHRNILGSGSGTVEAPYETVANWQAKMTTLFSKLLTTAGLLVCYTHGVNALGNSPTGQSADITPDDRDFLLELFDTYAGLGVRFRTVPWLMQRSGWDVVQSTDGRFWGRMPASTDRPVLSTSLTGTDSVDLAGLNANFVALQSSIDELGGAMIMQPLK